MLNPAALAVIVVAQSATSIDTYTQPGLKDLTLDAQRLKASQKELRKINKDFGQSFRVKSSTIQLKEPMMLRVVGEYDGTKVEYVIKDGKKVYKMPHSGLKYSDDIAKKPGKRQTALDFGLLTPPLFDSFFTAKYIRKDRRSGHQVFDLTYVSSLKDGTRHRVWIDPAKKFTSKREWYSQVDGRLMATFTYEDPKQFGAIWMPTKLTVHNSDNKLAGQTAYKNIKVNSGLASSLFKT
jgi:outer membrane lipoprotein-sorting protein